MKTRSKTSSPARSGQTSAWLSLPPIAFLALTIGVPLILVIIYAFLSRSPSGFGVSWEFTTKPFVQILVQEKLDGTTGLDVRYLKVLWNSFYFAGITTVTTLIVAIPMAMWIATRPQKWRAPLVLAVTLPFWTSILIRTYAMRQLIDSKGVLGYILNIFGIGEGFDILYTPWATILGLTYTFLPFMILPIYSSAEQFDFRLAEAGYDLGAKRMKVLFRIVLPAIRPGIISGIALVFIPALGSFLQPDMLGGGKTDMIANTIANQFGQSRNWPFGAALSVFLIVVTAIVVAVTIKVGSRNGQKVELV